MVTLTFLSSNSKHDFCYTIANISPSHTRQCHNLTMHFSLRHLAAKMLSQLYHNFISSPYFFTSYETCSINVNSLFHAAFKNLHTKTFRHLGTSLLYIPYKRSEETTQRNQHTYVTTFPSKK